MSTKPHGQLSSITIRHVNNSLIHIIRMERMPGLRTLATCLNYLPCQISSLQTLQDDTASHALLARVICVDDEHVQPGDGVPQAHERAWPCARLQ